ASRAGRSLPATTRQGRRTERRASAGGRSGRRWPTPHHREARRGNMPRALPPSRWWTSCDRALRTAQRSASSFVLVFAALCPLLHRRSASLGGLAQFADLTLVLCPDRPGLESARFG